MKSKDAVGVVSQYPGSLSKFISVALQERDGDRDAMFVFFNGFRGGVSAPQPQVVSKRIWLCFAKLLRDFIKSNSKASGFHRQSDASACETSLLPTMPKLPSIVCDIGIYSTEVFYVSLVESACILLGLCFCVFNPEDPPMRLQDLEQRRSPRAKVDAQVVQRLLDAAFVNARSLESSADESIAFVLKELACDLGDDRPAYLMHTSGSTGEPKCVIATRGNLLAYLTTFVFNPNGLSATQESQFFILSTPFFDPSIGDMISMLASAHGTLYAVLREDILSGAVAELLKLTLPSHVVTTPAVWATLSPHLRQRCPLVRQDGSSMKVFLGGERMQQEIIDVWATEVELYNIYGVTEVTIYQSVKRVLPGFQVSDVTCGSGGSGATITIDPSVLSSDALSEGNHDVGARCSSEYDAYGEVVFQGPQVCYGYADDPAKRVSFGVDRSTQCRFFRSGDVGKMVLNTLTSQMELVLRGRLDWQVKLNGQRTSLEEVEATLQRALHDVVMQCSCCYLPPTETTGPCIGAVVVVVEAESDASVLSSYRESITEALRELAELHLPSFMIPRWWILLPKGSTLPQTVTGKVNRSRLAEQCVSLRESFHEGEEAASGNVEATHKKASLQECSPLYEIVKSVWQSILGVPVHRRTHYIHAGGDSLGALKLTREVYIRLHAGSEDGIDEYGVLPNPFQPHLLLQHPRLGDYVQVLQKGLEGKEVTVDAGTKISLPTGIEEMSKVKVLLDVVAAGLVGLTQRLLCDALYPVNGQYARDHRCTTPLHVAVANYNSTTPTMLRMLLDAGAKTTAVTPDGVTPAHIAATVSADALRLLLDYGASLHCRDARQQSLLHFAARSGHVDSVRLLLFQFHLDLSTRDKWQRSAAHWAVLNGHTDILDIMASYYSSAMGQEAKETALTSQEYQNSRRRPRHEEGVSRFRRLARKRTHLNYETLLEIAHRMSPEDAEVHALCESLSTAVGEL